VALHAHAECDGRTVEAAAAPRSTSLSSGVRLCQILCQGGTSLENYGSRALPPAVPTLAAVPALPSVAAGAAVVSIRTSSASIRSMLPSGLVGLAGLAGLAPEEAGAAGVGIVILTLPRRRVVRTPPGGID
jgi:hypothetical protein